MKIHKYIKIVLVVFCVGLCLYVVFGRATTQEALLLIPASLGLLYWKFIISRVQKFTFFKNQTSLSRKFSESVPAILNFIIATLIYLAICHLKADGYLARFQKPIVFGLYIITAVIMAKRLNEFLLLAILPKVRRTENVLDDQIVLFVFATLKYSIIPIAVYMWLVYGLDIEISDWARTGFAISIAAIGFAFRNIINDFLASMIINMEQEIMVKDYITVNGHTGKVWKIEPRYTILKSLKGEEYIIPNSDLINNAVTNHSKRKFISIYMTFWVAHHEQINIEALKEFIKEECGTMLLTDHELSDDPVINIYKTDLKHEQVEFTITFLINSNKEGSGKIIFTENLSRERIIKQKIFDYIHAHLND